MIKYQALRHGLVKSVQTLTRCPSHVPWEALRMGVECLSVEALWLQNFLQLVQSQKLVCHIQAKVSGNNFPSLLPWLNSVVFLLREVVWQSTTCRVVKSGLQRGQKHQFGGFADFHGVNSNYQCDIPEDGVRKRRAESIVPNWSALTPSYRQHTQILAVDRLSLNARSDPYQLHDLGQTPYPLLHFIF